MQPLETADIVFLNGNPLTEELCNLVVDGPGCFHAGAQDFDDVQRRQRQQGLGVLGLGQAELAQGRRIGRGIRGDTGAGHCGAQDGDAGEGRGEREAQAAETTASDSRVVG
jgi:hypothetical protein